MTLTTHAIVGAGIAQLFPQYKIIAFLTAFLSHFLLDSIPHWDYRLRSSREDKENQLNSDIVVGKEFYVDAIKIAFDASLGLVLSFLLYQPATPQIVGLVFLGVIAGILPDPLQFAYFKIRKEPLITLQRFHIWIHAKTHLKEYPLPGATIQACIALFVVWMVYFIAK
jgi:hypothetical protein